MITPILLCGGTGSRLWPLSRQSYPKQFSQLMGGDSLFQIAARRFSGEKFNQPLIVTQDKFRFIAAEQLAQVDQTPCGILIEPEGRNTAPAALAAALFIAKTDPSALILLVPSDHVIENENAFRDVLADGIKPALDRQIVTFGIAPTKPETGYGWLEAGETIYPRVQRLTRFIEKPDAETAKSLLTNPKYLWNAGIVLTRADVLIEAFEYEAPDIVDTVSTAFDSAYHDMGFTRLDPEKWHDVRDISLDYAILENIENICLLKLKSKWSDLGSWDAVLENSEQDTKGNAATENTLMVDCKNTLLRSESDAIELVGLGLENIVAIAMPDAVLVADISRTQDVRHVVQSLKQKQVKQADSLPVDHRPWGWVETLVCTENFQVRRIYIKPHQALSLQSHEHRSEHWVIVDGQAQVTADDRVSVLGKNQSAYIPAHMKHRLENRASRPLVVIEVQTGSYLGEDDVVRYQDNYQRA